MATGSNKTITNSYYANGKIFAGFPCVISHNAGRMTYYDMSNVTLDVMKQSSAWVINSGSPVFDSDGWITDIASGSCTKYIIVSNDDANYKAGNYTVKWTGTATVSIANRTVNVVGPNEINFDLAAGITGIAIWMTITGTGGFVDASCYLTSDEAALDAGEIWNPDYVAFFANNATIRVMDIQLTNGSPVRHISDMSTLNSSTWVKSAGLGGYGVPPEALADLSNKADTDLWACIPHQATDATITDFATRSDNTLDVGRKCFIEYTNEAWNSAGAFRDQFRYTWHDHAPTLEATLSGGIFTAVGHGLTTGDEIATFNTPERTVSPYGNASYMYAIVRSVDTFELALSNDDAINDIVEPVPSELVKLVYKEVTSYPSSNEQAKLNYAVRAAEVFALTDAVMGRARAPHVVGSHVVNSSTTDLIYRDPNIEAATDFLAIAPYVRITDMPSLESSTPRQIMDWILDQYDDMFTEIRGHSEFTGKPVICYEGGGEYIGQTEAEQVALDAFHASDECLEFYPTLGQMFANAHIREICFFQSHSINYGTQNTIGDITRPKWVSIQPYMDTGFYRRGS